MVEAGLGVDLTEGITFARMPQQIQIVYCA